MELEQVVDLDLVSYDSIPDTQLDLQETYSNLPFPEANRQYPTANCDIPKVMRTARKALV